jgi:tetratricopeptide (TPR) repeat protein
MLSSGYETRKRLLGGDHQDTVQITLILGPLYVDMGRFEDAEKLYLEAFHAQERVKGANSPELSLYIKLLAGVYEKQDRFTEAQALYEHMRGLFRDAFGAQRYAVNRERDRRADINRPVSQYFPLTPDYGPTDLVSAAQYSIPTSKSPSAEEMKLRLAADPDADPREANLPARLAQLISLCRSESGEKISLRSGYRAYATQRALYQRLGEQGTVTPPGMSEHQTGLAADINVNDRFMRQSDRSFQCFEENAFRYGFILSYPPGNDYLPGKDAYEPWHWRYVGVQTAHLYREAGPHQRPQEFLAALPCYQERAASGYFPTAGEPDICLEEERLQTAAANPPAVDQPQGEKPQPARILNDVFQ